MPRVPYHVSDLNRGEIMRRIASGEPRWKIAAAMRLPLGAVKYVVAKYAGRSRESKVPPLDEDEYARRRAEVREGWSPRELVERRELGTRMTSALMRFDADGMRLHNVAPLRRGA